MVANILKEIIEQVGIQFRS